MIQNLPHRLGRLGLQWRNGEAACRCSFIAGLSRKFRALAAALIAVAVLGGCAASGLFGNSSKTTKNTTQWTQNADGVEPAQGGLLDKRAPVKIGLILPLSGDDRTAIIAKNMRRAGEMALFEFDNPSVQLIVKDTKATPEGAKAAAVSALASGAEIIIGPLFAASVTAVKPIAKQAGVPVIAFSSDPRVAGGGVYLLSFLAGHEVPRIISYAAGRGKRRFAALIPDDSYGTIVEAKFRAAVARSGGIVAALKTYPRTPNGMLAPAKDIKQDIDNAILNGAPIDALFIPADRETLPMIGSLMPYADIDTKAIQLIGTSGWDFANAGREKALLGGWFPSPDPRGWQDFAQRFSKTNGTLPPRIASLTFDAVSIAINLSSGAKGRRYSNANLTRPSGFSGTDGLLRFTGNGLPERGLAVLEVQKFGASVIDTAPSVFGGRSFSFQGGDTAALPAAGARFNLGSP